jgi:hypothetical protein
MVNYQLMNVNSIAPACAALAAPISPRSSLHHRAMNERTNPRETPDPADDERDRRVTNIFLLVFFAVIVGSGLWLVNAMVEQRAIDDCAAQGRRNCVPIETPAR